MSKKLCKEVYYYLEKLITVLKFLVKHSDFDKFDDSLNSKLSVIDLHGIGASTLFKKGDCDTKNQILDLSIFAKKREIVSRKKQKNIILFEKVN